MTHVVLIVATLALFAAGAANPDLGERLSIGGVVGVDLWVSLGGAL